MLIYLAYSQTNLYKGKDSRHNMKKKEVVWLYGQY